MDLQTRKLQFIQEVLHIKSEEMIAKLEKMLFNEREKEEARNFMPMTKEELNAKIDRAEEDYRQNKIYTSDEVLKEIESWK